MLDEKSNLRRLEASSIQTGINPASVEFAEIMYYILHAIALVCNSLNS